MPSDTDGIARDVADERSRGSSYRKITRGNERDMGEYSRRAQYNRSVGENSDLENMRMQGDAERGMYARRKARGKKR